MSKKQAKAMLAIGSPLENTLFLFSPPAGMTSSDARKRALVVLGVSFALVVLSFALLKYLTDHPHESFGGGMMVPLLVIVGSAFLLVPASLYRLLFGTEPPANGFTKFLRGVFALGLFMVTFIGSLIIYGQLSP